MARPRKSKSSVPDNISEEYYQISLEILTSFPKYRPPLDLFQFREDIKQLFPFSRKGTRLSNEQVEELQNLCEAGVLFVSRADHPIYSQHMVKQLDLVLLDVNLKEGEVADIIVRALGMRLGEFYEQPVRPVFEVLYRDLMVFTEYVVQDKHRIRLFMRRLHSGDHMLVSHSLNTMFTGLWLFLYHMVGEDYRRRTLDRVALALLLHDMGMSRIPPFILDKTQPLKGEEKDKILLHQPAGIKMLQKFDLSYDEMNQAIMEHHERLDGSGYPNRLKDATISKFGRVCALSDSFAAMITNRPYAPGKNPKEASKELAADKSRYDPRFSGVLSAAYLTGMFELHTPASAIVAEEAEAAKNE